MPKHKNDIYPTENQQILSDEDRLKRDVYRPDMEKFRLFTNMLRRNAVLKKAVIRHQ